MPWLFVAHSEFSNLKSCFDHCSRFSGLLRPKIIELGVVSLQARRRQSFYTTQQAAFRAHKQLASTAKILARSHDKRAPAAHALFWKQRSVVVKLFLHGTNCIGAAMTGDSHF